MTKEADELIAHLWQIGFTPSDLATQQNRDIPIQRLLWQIVQAKDTRLLPGFCILIAHCNRNQIPIDVEGLILERKFTTAERRCMSQLLLISLQVLKALDLKIPPSLKIIEAPLQMAHGDLLDQPAVKLTNGLELDTQAFQKSVRAHLDPGSNPDITEKKLTKPLPLLEQHLIRLFAPKQIELIHKKLEGQPLTKTEREYYSRVVRKRLAAIADQELHKTARFLIFGSR